MVDAPCSGWALDTGCCPTWGDYTPEVQADATAYATTIMWASTGRRFGLCTNVVRPCGRYRRNTPAIYGYEMAGGTWVPYIDSNGTWRNCACPSMCCNCHPDCEALLPFPVASVSEVTQNGLVIDPSAYRVDDRRWLVRTDGDCWPLCQDYSADSGDGTFQVTYLRGETVPPAVLTAAGILACEFAKACVGAGDCRLPGRITSLTRQGVSVNLVDTDTLMRNNLTGILEVDQIILAYNPANLHRRLRVWSPDQQVHRTTTSA